MCRGARCNLCSKKAWWGCGRHVEGVMNSVPEAERCTCEPKIERGGKLYPPISDDKSKTAKKEVADGEMEDEDDELKKDDEGKEGKEEKRKSGVGHAVRNAIDSLSNLAQWQNLGAR
ncbi:hypothetical protein N431DRAFT_15687 [Stipitochalara longipes BDJ]|nr:hypothetical protein N431DRAFT_15687 [Stipitochalara longipes BDJ]